ncbi:MAG: GntR family transcriptional regulator [Trueperaceae bacterium]|nr:GntR family transcriptional regulator [Trueperaceae bacterium]
MTQTLDLTLFSVDKRLPTPAYLQLKDKLSRAIDEGQLSPGTALPSERDLADTLGLSRMTVRRAFEELVAEKQLEQRQGSGTYVLPKRVEQMIDRVLGFTEEAQNLGFKSGSQLLEAKLAVADMVVAKALNLNNRQEVLSIARLRTADDEPLALQVAYLIPDLKDLSLEQLAKKGSLYKTIKEQFGLSPQGARQTVSAKLPSAEERQLLHIAKDVPVLALERITLDLTGRPFEFVRSSYRGDRYKMVLDLRSP